jgi:hypothetical protein
LTKTLIFIALTFAFTSGAFLFKVKHHVLGIENNLKTVCSQLNQAKEDLNLLRTEWTYLTHPKRIHRLVCEHLPQLQPLQQTQISALPPAESKRIFTERTPSSMSS